MARPSNLSNASPRGKSAIRKSGGGTPRQAGRLFPSRRTAQGTAPTPTRRAETAAGNTADAVRQVKTTKTTPFSECCDDRTNRTFAVQDTLRVMSDFLIGYAHVSTEQQDLDRPARGADGARRACWPIYVDYGLTGTNRARPELRERRSPPAAPAT